jgi:hypothetical protein
MVRRPAYPNRGPGRRYRSLKVKKKGEGMSKLELIKMNTVLSSSSVRATCRGAWARVTIG